MKKTLLALLSIVTLFTGCVTEVGVYGPPPPSVVYVNPYPVVVYPHPYYYRHQVIHPHSIYVAPPIRSGPHHR